MRVRLFLVWITPVLMVALCIGLGWLLLQHLDDKINLPLLAIAGVILLIGVLSLVAARSLDCCFHCATHCGCNSRRRDALRRLYA